MYQVLIIDDEINIQKSVSDILSSNGFKPIMCSNPANAMDVIKSEDIAFVLYMDARDGRPRVIKRDQK
jgi:DNA-binding NtrC family response regulator